MGNTSVSNSHPLVDNINDLFGTDNTNLLICTKCGGPRGELGAMGSHSGFLGPCGHEESRGNIGPPEPATLYQIIMYDAMNDVTYSDPLDYNSGSDDMDSMNNAYNGSV